MKRYLEKFKKHEELNVVCIGDSTTSQEWCHPNWVDWLNFTFRQSGDWSKNWNRKLFNNGKDGGTVLDFIEHFDREISRFSPDVVISSFGFNHIEQSHQLGAVESDLDTLFTKIGETGADLVVWSTYDVPHLKHSDDLARVREIDRQKTAEFEGVFIDVYKEFQKYDLSKIFTYFALEKNEQWEIEQGDRDYLHCNVIGNQIIAQMIVEQAFFTKLLSWEKFGTMHEVELSGYGK